MAAITIRTNIGEISAKIRKNLEILNDREYLLRPVCFDLIDLMTKRIHSDGKAADDSPIGTYSSKYLELREKKYGRLEGSKVVVSLTRFLEQHWAVIPTEKGYGVGFLDAQNPKDDSNGPTNIQKARFVEQNKGKKIFSLSASENEHAVITIQDLVRQALNK